ncbi:MAG TPA: hypothetical protein DHV26_04350 [Cytophagales bacterium]|nr:hypothetical protein [Cytophagales bacterium]HRG07297.1 DUF4919 domain-containing protein [Cyclobacteriaceae bacterium]
MSKLIRLIILSLFVGQTRAQEAFNYTRDFTKILEQTNDPSSDLYFDKLLKRFRLNDNNLTDKETLSLLIGFTDDPHFKPYHYLTVERSIYSLNAQGKFKEALQLADSLLVTVPLSQQAIIEKSYSHYKLDQTDSSDFYMWKFKRIMRTMASTGDGLSPESAIFALGPADGQNFIYKYLASDIGTMGSGRDKNGNFIDILTALIKDEKTGETKSQTMYFHVQHAVKKMFDPGELEDAMKKKKKNKKEKLKVGKDGRVYIKN